MVKDAIILGKRYEVVSKIGAGGMADVYKGKDLMLNRYVAIKVLKKEYKEDEMFVRKFRSEAQAAAGLMNPNIVNVYDVGEDRGLNYMIMEIVDGITLKEYIQRKGRLSHKEVISIAIQMCTGIGAAHAAGIVHRDIKPHNIMISKDGKVKVTDFGIAKAISSNTISSNAMGSVHYTSPEQARGGYSDAKSDIYSIGITLYEMVTGQVPFDGDSTVSVAIKHLQEEITPPSEIVSGIPYSLEQIILKCTQKNSERRYASTAALIQDLKRSLVNPDGDFVVIPPLRNADTVIITDEELDDIRNEYEDNQEYDDQSYSDQYEDDYENFQDEENYNYEEDYDEYEEDYDDYKRKSGGKRRKDSDDVNPGMKKIMKILTIVVVIIIAFILLFAVGKAVGIFKTGGTGILAEEEEKEVKVPNVVGMPREEALKLLNSLGLGMDVIAEEESDKYEKGTVCEQKIKEGEMVPKNTKIEVTVSSKLLGEEIEMPDVVGYDETSAQKMLEDVKLTKVRSEFEYSNKYDAGDVIRTTPEAGAKVTSETEIVMYVSKGTEKIEVPNVVGDEVDSAEKELENAGLKVAKTTYEYNDDVAKNKVVFQSITAGKKVELYTEITIVVSKGPKPEEKVKVPNLSGLTLEGARALLESKGLLLVDGGEEYSEENIGRVSRWEPYNTSVPKGTKITVWISKGIDEYVDDSPEDSEADVNDNLEGEAEEGVIE